MLQLKELEMARSLHCQKAWEELAEDPFRGLRAGPVTFSPFLFFLPVAILNGSAWLVKS